MSFVSKEPLNEEQKKWHELVEKGEATCYIKPTRYKHDSGFRTFEVGYCTLGKDNKVDKKIVLGVSSDHIHTDYMALVDPEHLSITVNLDLTLDGYIRIWGHTKNKTPIRWSQWVLSSAELVSPEKSEIMDKMKSVNGLFPDQKGDDKKS